MGVVGLLVGFRPEGGLSGALLAIGVMLTFGFALVIQGMFRHQFGSSGLPYAMPTGLEGGHNLGFMFLPKYRAWVILAVLIATDWRFLVLPPSSITNIGPPMPSDYAPNQLIPGTKYETLPLEDIVQPNGEQRWESIHFAPNRDGEGTVGKSKRRIKEDERPQGYAWPGKRQDAENDGDDAAGRREHEDAGDLLVMVHHAGA